MLPTPMATINSTSVMPLRRCLIDVIVQSITGNQRAHGALPLNIARRPAHLDVDLFHVSDITLGHVGRIADADRAVVNEASGRLGAGGVKGSGETGGNKPRAVDLIPGVE